MEGRGTEGNFGSFFYLKFFEKGIDKKPGMLYIIIVKRWETLKEETYQALKKVEKLFKSTWQNNPEYVILGL